MRFHPHNRCRYFIYVISSRVIITTFGQALAQHRAKLSAPCAAGRTPAHEAAANGGTDALEFLARYGAQIGEKDHEGYGRRNYVLNDNVWN